MSSFRVGQRVRIVRPYAGMTTDYPECYGQEGLVVAVGEWTQESKTTGGSGLCLFEYKVEAANGALYLCSKDDLEPIIDPKQSSKDEANQIIPWDLCLDELRKVRDSIEEGVT